ncbi:unnamed protein product [Leptosia nina]|uniref:Uncharacterized protein n=1 Tax=Leptosia nina TaxID=320188 RepID=A0AAV1K3D5_9NEOP
MIKRTVKCISGNLCFSGWTCKAVGLPDVLDAWQHIERHTYFKRWGIKSQLPPKIPKIHILNGSLPCFPQYQRKRSTWTEERINCILEHKSPYAEEKLLMCIAATLNF